MVEIANIIKEVRTLDVSTHELVQGIIAGAYHSVFKGQGIEFSEIREYRYGDDVRSIDWNVTARFNKPFIKEFVEERDLATYILFDYSASGSFGSTVEKKHKGIEIAATLLFSALKNNDATGLCIFTETVEKFIPARKSKKHVLEILSNLLQHQAIHAKTNIKEGLTFLSKVLKKKSLIFLISDMYGDSFAKELSLLRKRHDVIAIQIMDLTEQEIPAVGEIQLEDEETGEQLIVDTSDVVFQQNYKKLMKEKNTQIATICKRARVDLISLTTNQDLFFSLQKFFKQRARVKRL